MVAYQRLLAANRGWIMIAVALFVVGVALGALAAVTAPEATATALRPVFERMALIGRRVVASDSPLVRTWLIFQNNALATLFLLAFAPVLGLAPVLALLANSAALGTVLVLARELAGNDFSPLTLVVAIGPHGIIELPALILAAAWGIKLGWTPWLPGAAGRRLAVFRTTVVEAGRIYALVVVLLLFAAFIEGNITLWLVRALGVA